MKIKFQADADLREEIVKGIRRRVPEIDFQTANEADLEGVPDPDVWAIAARDDRILVTNDRQTMPTHFAEFILEHSCGVLLLSKKMSTKKAIDHLILIWSVAEPAEYIDRIMSIK